MRLAAVVAGVALAVLVPAALGQVEGGCTATINGEDVSGAPNASSAITVRQDEVLDVRGTAPGAVSSYRVNMAFGPFKFPAASGSGSGNEWTGRVAVKDYAKYGVGLYRVQAETTGQACSAWFYVKVTGRNPLTTFAGAGAAAITGLGVCGMAVTAARTWKLPKARLP